MTQSDTEETRANRDGDPCPPWCTTDHDQLVLADRPKYGYCMTHVSDPVTFGVPMVRVIRHSGTRHAEVDVTLAADGKAVTLALTPAQAGQLAVVGAATGLDFAALADELNTAAAIAREGR